MGTHVPLAFFLLMTLLSRSGAQSQAPSLTAFAAFCNEVGTSGSPPSPFIEMLCRQVAERADTQPPPSAAIPWSVAEAFTVSEQTPTVATDLPVPLSTQQEEQVAATQSNYSSVIPQETNVTSDYQLRGNETFNVDNIILGADNVTDTFPFGRGQTIIILNNSFPQEQIDLEVARGSDFSSNVHVSIPTTGEPNNRSNAQPLHIEPSNVSTFYVGERASSELAGVKGRNGTLNTTLAFQTQITNFKTVKRGDQMPSPDNASSVSPPDQENSRNQTYNNTDILGQLPEVAPQQSLGEEELLIHQTDVQRSNETLNTNQSTGILQVVEKEQTNVAADGINSTVDSRTERQAFVEQQSTIMASQTEVPATTEVAEDGLHYSSLANSVRGIDSKDAGNGSSANATSTQSGIQVTYVNNATLVAAGVGGKPETVNVESSTVDGFSEVQPSISENVATKVIDTTQSTFGKSSEQMGTETNLLGEPASGPTFGNEQPLSSAQGTTEKQSIVDQILLNVSHNSGAVLTQTVEPAEDWLETNTVIGQSDILNTESIVFDSQNPAQAKDQGAKGQSPPVLIENLGYDSQNEIWSTSGDISTVVPTNSFTSEQGFLSNNQNESRDAQHRSVVEPLENSENKSKTPNSEPFAINLSRLDNAEESGPTGLNATQENQETSSPEGASNSNWGIKSTTHFRVSGNNLSSSPTSTGSNSPVGVSSSESNPVPSTTLPPTPIERFVGDSILVLKEVSTKLLDEVRCRQSLNEFWKNVTETFRDAVRRVSASRKPTVRDMTASVTEVVESYRRESPYWTTIAAKLEEATSEWRWRQLHALVAERYFCDRAEQLRVLSVLRELCQAVRASLSNPECRAAGAQPAADSCDQFVLCYRAGWQWRALSLHCPRGSAFSRSQRRCVWWPLADCRPTPSTGHGDDDDDSSSDSSDSDSDVDSAESEEKSWSLFRHGRSLFRMFDFRH